MGTAEALDALETTQISARMDTKRTAVLPESELEEERVSVENVYELYFHRLFSINPYRSLRMKLCEMSFCKDWPHTDRGDPYPIVRENGAALGEQVENGRIAFSSDAPGERARLIGRFFPYASSEVCVDALDGEGARVGLEFAARSGSLCRSEGAHDGLEFAARSGSACTPDGVREGLESAARSGSPYTPEDAPGLCVFVERAGAEVCVCHEEFLGGRSLGVVRHGTRAFEPGGVLFVSAHGAFFDVSLGREFVCTIQADGFSDICRRSAFMNAGVSLYVGLPAGGHAAVSRAESFLDGGLSHADMKPVRYEDGTPILENGRLFLTLSSRLQAGSYQFVVSWNPSTCELRPEGAIFFDYGDGRWCADVAISLIYHRQRREWLFWATAFSHGHILCYGTSAGDPRFGITVLDATLMEAQRLGSAADDSLSVQAGGRGASVAELDDDTLWLAKTGDEDPDFTYDRERGKWYMTICRNVDGEGYRYFLFESDEPFSGYRHVCHTESGENTGGLMVRIRGQRALVCGSDFKARAEYRVYPLGDFSRFQRLTCDFDDGGFRGWGCLMPVPCGNRTKYVWMTFDRHNGSDYNWSYGNLYAYEADEMDFQ